MTLYTRNMTQTATYFAPLGETAFGLQQYDTGVNVVCRWQDKTDLTKDSEGREVVSTSTVYVGTEVAVRGRLKLGADETIDDAKEIISISRSPSLDGSKELLKVML